MPTYEELEQTLLRQRQEQSTVTPTNATSTLLSSSAIRRGSTYEELEARELERRKAAPTLERQAFDATFAGGPVEPRRPPEPPQPASPAAGATEPSALEIGALKATKAVAPGVAGFGAGAAVFTPTTLATAPFLGPFAPVAGLGASLLVGGGVSTLVSYGQDLLTRLVQPKEAVKQAEEFEAAGEKAHPYAALTGQLIGASAGGKPVSLKTLGSIIKGASTLDKQAVRGIANMAASSAMQGGIEAYSQLTGENKDISATKLFIAMAYGAIVSEPLRFAKTEEGRRFVRDIRKAKTRMGLTDQDIQQIQSTANRITPEGKELPTTEVPSVIQEGKQRGQEAVQEPVGTTVQQEAGEGILRDTGVEQARAEEAAVKDGVTLYHVGAAVSKGMPMRPDARGAVWFSTSETAYGANREGVPVTQITIPQDKLLVVEDIKGREGPMANEFYARQKTGTKAESLRIAEEMGYEAVQRSQDVAMRPNTVQKYLGETSSSAAAQPKVAAGEPVEPTAMPPGQKAPVTEAATPIPPSKPPISLTQEGAIPEGMHERRTVTRAAESEQFEPEVSQARESGAAYAQNTPVATMVKDAETRAATEPDAVLAEAKSTTDPYERSAKLIGYINARKAKGEVLGDAFNDVIADATTAGTLLRFVRELKILSPQGRADLHMTMLKNWMKRNKVTMPSDRLAEVKRLFAIAEAMPEGPRKDTALAQAVMQSVSTLPIGKFLLNAYRYTNALSNPRSHLRNVIGNAWQLTVMRPGSLLMRGNMVEAGKFIKDSAMAIGDATDAFRQSFRDMDISNKIDMSDTTPFDKAMQKRLPAVLTIVGRTMEAADQFFSTLIKTAETTRLVNKGIDFQLAKDRADELAERYLFRDPLGADMKDPTRNVLSQVFDSVGTLLDQARKSVMGPVLEPILMFLRTPTAIAKRGAEASPFGYIVKGGLNLDKLAKHKYRKSFAKLNESQQKLVQDDYDERVGQARLGVLTVAIGSMLAMADRTTWRVPKDKEAKEAFYASGRKPYSIRIGDKWVPMWTFGPLAFSLAIPAAVKDQIIDDPETGNQNMVERMAEATAALARFYSESTPFSSLAALQDALMDDDSNKWGKFFAFTAGQYIPASGLIRYANMFADPTYRKARDVRESFMRDIPILSQKLQPYQTPEGMPAMRTMLDILPPFPIGQQDSEYESIFKERLATLKEQQRNNAEAEELADNARTDPKAKRELATFVLSLPKKEQNRIKARLKQRLNMSLFDFLAEGEPE